MRAVVQRVRSASVTAEQVLCGTIAGGLLVYLGVAAQDGVAERDYIVSKIAGLRVFPDDDGRMNRDVKEAAGSILLVSQFTLYGDVRRGRRPSYSSAAAPRPALRWYQAVADRLREEGIPVATGKFQAHMQVRSINDGPVTILLDSQRAF